MGFTVDHGAHPTFEGGTGYGGNGGQNCHGVNISNSATPECKGLTGISGQKDANNYGINVEDSAAPKLDGCVGRYKTYSQFISLTGDGSDPVDSGFPLDQYDSDVATTGFPSVLESIHVRIVTPVSGATMDIGTTAGGTEIASSIDCSNAERVHFDYNRVRFTSGDEIYFTVSDQNVGYNPRYTIGVDQNAHGLHLNTYGEAVISGGSYLSGTRASAGYIGDDAINAKRYSLSGAQFRPADDINQSGIEGQTDDATTDPIRNCGIFGGTVNLSPAQK
jgi:hypothetical protein